ncbi:hypothetical protein FWF74_00560 [Candidatus Saccharibacteria bacterium]|nr:hypothetical protein [Candidatus Saccharibacteria bacterium]MCL1963341.1 hypothetical protein [Candidatus Saccharibacteria bacterium]
MRFAPSRRDRRVFGKIANEYNLVYFGSVDPRIDTDYKMIRGLTVAPNMRDENYTVGSVDGFEIAFLQRSRKVEVAYDKWRNCRWTILQVAIKDTDLPHIFIDARDRRTAFGDLLMSMLRLPEIPWQNFSPNDKFSKVFALHSRPYAIQTIRKIFTQEMQKTFIENFSLFDIEIVDDKILVYAANQKVLDLQMLDHMLRVGLLLARKIKSTKK